MMRSEKTRHIREDREDLERTIKHLENVIKEQQAEGVPEWMNTNKILRQLRRQRT